MCKLLVAACFFACTINTQAKVLYLPDPIRYETNGQLFTLTQPISYESLIKRLGKLIQEDAGCAKTIDYPNASFIGYEEGVMPNKNKEIFLFEVLT